MEGTPLVVTMTATAPDAPPGGRQTRIGELLAVIGPAGPRRTAWVHALAEALGAVPAPSAPEDAEAWRALRHRAASGTTVVAACAAAADAGDHPHRTVLLPAD
jgi:hypothetical protein